MANVPQQVYYLVQQPANSAPQPNQIVRQNGGRNGPYNGQRRPPQGPRQQQLIPVSGNNMIPVSGNNVIPVPGNNGNANPTNPPVPHPQEGMATVRELAARQNALTGELLQAVRELSELVRVHLKQTAPIPPTRPIRQRRASSPTPSTSRVVDPLDPLGLKTLN
uniref:CSTF_C domain-containing protein n=1 Tax=Globodera pallida TaxID=36090 RepID=A0A183BU58_GLOPA